VISIPISNAVAHLTDEARIRSAIESILADAQIRHGTISVAIVDDPKIHELNRQFLQHDYTTDVLSFVLDQSDGCLEGEVIVSIDTAARMAATAGWSVDDELLLYIVHGTLHLVGHDDLDPESRATMRVQERHYLKRFGLERRAIPEEE
jgi:probable rRNA maturation factor